MKNKTIKKIKRSLACLLVLVMCISMIDLSTFTSEAEAADGAETTVEAAEEKTEPTTPEDTEEPEEPNTPVTPEEPNASVTPEEPEEPKVPVTPEEPEEPNAPVTPEEPEEPKAPVTPEEPEEPKAPVTPEEPEEPKAPVTPEEPEEPKASVTPEESEEPKAPVNPEVSEDPNTPVVPEDDENAALIEDLLSRITAAIAGIPDADSIEGTEEGVKALNELGMTLSALYEECFEYGDDEKVAEAQEKLAEALTGLQELLGLGAEALDEDIVCVASIGDENYESLKAAIEAAGESAAVITLTAETISESITIPVGANITLELNGKTLTGTSDANGKMSNVITNSGTLTIQDTVGTGVVIGGTDTGTGTSGRGGIAVVNNESGICTILSGTIKRGDEGTFGNYTVQNMGTMYIQGGLITNNSNTSNLVVNYGQRSKGYYADGYDAKMYISGGTLRQESMSALKNDPGTYLEISGTAALIERQDSKSAYACNFYGTVVMTGGSIKTTGIIPVLSWKKGNEELPSSFTVSGGTIECEEIRVLNGYMEVIEEGSENIPTLEITGSAQINTNKIYALQSNDAGSSGWKIVSNGTTAEIKISGGTFTNPVDPQFLAEGCKQSEDGKVLAPDEAGIGINDVVSIDGNGYASLKEAVTHAGSSAVTITLLKDVEESVTIPSGADITLDLNGKTLTNASETGKNGHTIENKGKLTVIGSGTVDSIVHGKAALYNYGEAIVVGGTFIRSEEGVDATGKKNSYYTVANSGTMTFTGGTVTGTSDFSSLVCNFADMTIQGGTFAQATYITLMNKPDAVMNISGGTINGDMTDGSEVIQAYGTVNISGGRVTGNSIGVWAYDDLTGAFGAIRSKLSVSGDAVIDVSQIRTVAWEIEDVAGKPTILPELVITGSPQIFGKLMIARKTENYGPVGSPVEEVPEAEQASFGSILISGGIFDREPSASYLADGYLSTLENGVYKVDKAPDDDESTDDPADDESTDDPADNESTDDPADDESTDDPTDNPADEPTNNPTTPSRGGGSRGSSSSGGSSESTPAPATAPAEESVPAAAPAAGNTASPAVQTVQAAEEAEETETVSTTEETVTAEDSEVPTAEEPSEEEFVEAADEETPRASALEAGSNGIFTVIPVLIVLLAAGFFLLLFLKRRKAEEEA